MSPAAVLRCSQGSECGGCPALCQRSVCRKGTGSSPCIVPQSVGTYLCAGAYLALSACIPAESHGLCRGW